MDKIKFKIRKIPINRFKMQIRSFKMKLRLLRRKYLRDPYHTSIFGGLLFV